MSNETRYSIGEPEFEDLIAGRVVTLAPGVKLALLDIGFARMQYLIEEAEDAQ